MVRGVPCTGFVMFVLQGDRLIVLFIYLLWVTAWQLALIQNGLFRLVSFCFLAQANKKDCEAFDDDDVDLSSGSDFDEDEDPDQIGVPGKRHNFLRTNQNNPSSLNGFGFSAF